MRSAKEMFFNVVVLWTVFTAGVCNMQSPAVTPDKTPQLKSLGDCQSCKIFSESFKLELLRSEQNVYISSDVEWTEEQLATDYLQSDMRLHNVLEGVCKQEVKYSKECHNIAERAKEFIKDWWSGNTNAPDVYKHICVEKLQVCCPEHHFGKDCSPCPGDHSNLCSGNGKCRGDGTRKGNGTCLCDPGYEGENCDRCMVGYYLSYKDDKKILCSPCNKACMGGCRHGSQKDCAACKPGYMFDSEEGCLDINECDDVKRCQKNEFCLNSIGSYVCVKCDVSCKTCHGYGPDMCRKCAVGYSRKGEFCIADREDEDLSERLTTTRYMTYVGLLIATGVLLPKSTSLGSLVGAMVLSYIVVAEYYCMINGHDGLANLQNFDLMQLFRT